MNPSVSSPTSADCSAAYMLRSEHFHSTAVASGETPICGFLYGGGTFAGAMLLCLAVPWMSCRGQQVLFLG
jgi:hypothetical protein